MDKHAPRTTAAPAIGVLRLLRQLAGLRQADIAAALGRSSQYVSLVERGVCVPTAAEVETLSSLLSVPVTELLCEDSK